MAKAKTTSLETTEVVTEEKPELFEVLLEGGGVQIVAVNGKIQTLKRGDTVFVTPEVYHVLQTSGLI